MADWETGTAEAADGWERAPVAAPKEAQPNVDTGGVGVTRGIQGVGRAVGKAGEWLDKAAYNVGGRVTDWAANKMPAEAAAGLGTAANVATQAVPMVLGGEALKFASPALQMGAQKAMKAAVNPSFDAIKSGDAARAIDTMLEKGINVTEGGMAKMQDMISKLNDQITQKIASSGETVNKLEVAKTLREALQKFSRTTNPNADIATIKSAWREFLNHPLLKGKKEIPVTLAQELKQGNYRKLTDTAFGTELNNAQRDSMKKLARGLREKIAAKVPDVDLLNKSEGELINAMDVAERRALSAWKANPGGFGWLTSSPSKFAAYMANRSPAFLSYFANVLEAGSEAIPANVGRAAGAVAGHESGKAPRDGN